MGKRRTKKQKQGAKHQYRYTVADDQVGGKDNEVVKAKSIGSEATTLYAYDPQLIIQDLTKTVIVSGVILGIELAIFWFWR